MKRCIKQAQPDQYKMQLLQEKNKHANKPDGDSQDQLERQADPTQRPMDDDA